jgi:Domain of unknown function (DUF2804), C-terminal
MPSRLGTRPLKAWRYVGVFGPEVMLCVGSVRIGRARQSFWAVWDRMAGRFFERTRLGGGRVVLLPGRVRILEPRVQVDLALEEVDGVESVARSGTGYAWTRKQGGIPATGLIAIDGIPAVVDARAVVDDTAAYYARRTSWHWSAGVGAAPDGRTLAWNLVSGVNDSPSQSERTVWVDGRPQEVAPVSFADDLSRVGELHFTPEAERSRRENLLLVRSSYRQPFGTFSGRLPDGSELAQGYGVMEVHDAVW